MPWALGPPDGRYLIRRRGTPPDSPPAHVLVLATLGAPERRRLAVPKRQHKAQPEPEPTPVTVGRATIIDVGDPLPNPTAASAWLNGAGEDELKIGLDVLNRTLHAFRLVTTDPHVNAVARAQLLIARIGYGAGEQVADGRWADAKELLIPSARLSRTKMLHPQARLAALLGGREAALACEELVLRARSDLDHGRGREAALQVLVALDAALTELALDPHSAALTERLTELRGQRDAVAAAAQTALGGQLSAEQREAVGFTVGRIEAALRARAVASA